MKKIVCIVALVGVTAFPNAQIKLGNVLNSASKSAQALTFSNADAQRLSKEAVDWMDANNPVAAPNDPYAIRLNKLFAKHKNYDGLPLNYKVYKVRDINAFATADGSVRVFAGLMDIMDDDELLAVIGHEIGHVKHEDTKNAIKQAYLKAAVLDAAASTSQTVRTLNDSELGKMANAFLDSKHSRTQETNADEYSYEFLKNNGYNVVGAYKAFKKLALLSKSKPTTFQRMMSSHPDSDLRAERMKKMAEKDGLWKDPREITLPKM